MWTQTTPLLNNSGEMESERYVYRRDEHGPILGFVYCIDGTWYADAVSDGCDVGSKEDAMFVVEEFYHDYDPE